MKTCWWSDLLYCVCVCVCRVHPDHMAWGYTSIQIKLHSHLFKLSLTISISDNQPWCNCRGRRSRKRKTQCSALSEGSTHWSQHTELLPRASADLLPSNAPSFVRNNSFWSLASSINDFHRAVGAGRGEGGEGKEGGGRINLDPSPSDGN